MHSLLLAATEKMEDLLGELQLIRLISSVTGRKIFLLLRHTPKISNPETEESRKPTTLQLEEEAMMI